MAWRGTDVWSGARVSLACADRTTSDIENVDVRSVRTGTVVVNVPTICSSAGSFRSATGVPTTMSSAPVALLSATSSAVLRTVKRPTPHCRATASMCRTVSLSTWVVSRAAV